MQKDDEVLQKHTLNLWLGDYEKLRELCPDIGAGPVVRRLVRRFIMQVEANGGLVDATLTDVKVEI